MLALWYPCSGDFCDFYDKDFFFCPFAIAIFLTSEWKSFTRTFSSLHASQPKFICFLVCLLTSNVKPNPTKQQMDQKHHCYSDSTRRERFKPGQGQILNSMKLEICIHVSVVSYRGDIWHAFLMRTHCSIAHCSPAVFSSVVHQVLSSLVLPEGCCLVLISWIKGNELAQRAL